ncbi:MAG: tetratricopeptide repeat protein [Myxococcales bacterium]|nr:tetratricopeptide repeat protein [Myxococcales bacterium]
MPRRILLPLLPLALLAGAPLLLAGCEKEEPKTALTYTQDAKRAYEAAMEEFDAHNWIDAQNSMREVKRKYSYSRYAKLAELRIADADFEQEKFAEAIREYRQFVHDHRSDPEEVAYARSRIAEAQYKQISDSFLLPTGDERDQASVLDAYKELRGYLHDYPEAKRSKEMRELLADVTARLIRHELYAARFYLARDNYDAAIMRIEYALRNFTTAKVSLASTDPPPRADGRRPDGARPSRRAAVPAPPTDADALDSGLEAEALLLLGETYLKMKKIPEATAAFKAIQTDYPKSGLVLQAERYLAYLKERGS